MSAAKKRLMQPIRISMGLFSRLMRCAMLTAMTPTMVEMAVVISAVSYTHLDVYKRQAYGRLSGEGTDIQSRLFLFYAGCQLRGPVSYTHLTADVPQGPFRQEVKQPIWDEKSIDTSLFIDDDGTPYLYFVAQAPLQTFLIESN